MATSVHLLVPHGLRSDGSVPPEDLSAASVQITLDWKDAFSLAVALSTFTHTEAASGRAKEIARDLKGSLVEILQPRTV